MSPDFDMTASPHAFDMRRQTIFKLSHAGITSASAPPPKTLRLIRYTNAEQAAAGVTAADAAILSQRERRSRRQSLLLAITVGAVGVAVAYSARLWVGRSFQASRS